MLPPTSRELILLRGIPGSGKTTMAKLIKSLADDRVEIEEICADDCWEKPYTAETFTINDHKNAHQKCQLKVTTWMHNKVSIIIVHNTFSTSTELQPYFELAGKFGYRVHTLICENRHGSKSKHNVPDDILGIMRNRFSSVL